MKPALFLFGCIVGLMVFGQPGLEGHSNTSSPAEEFYGKYRGKVVNNVDPLMLGRVLVHVPAISELPLPNWAMPCVPYAGENVGLFAMPPVGANVWVEFEGGDPNLPIWTGCFWGRDEIPVTPAIPDLKCFRTESAMIQVNDLSHTLLLSVEGPDGVRKIELRRDGILGTVGESTVSMQPNGEIKIPAGN